MDADVREYMEAVEQATTEELVEAELVISELLQLINAELQRRAQ